jgi:predicted RNase H-like nuclease (RuvC/YqgF family)
MENIDVSTEFLGLHCLRILIYSSTGTIIWEREMAHPLEAATLAVVREQENFKKQVATLTEGMRSLEREVDKRDGEIEELRRQLGVSQYRADHYLRWNTELTKQLHNINMFVQDAMQQARVEVEKRSSEAEEKVHQLTDEFKKDADVDLNELESTILQQGIKNGKHAKSVDKAEAVI